jgi:hypothetical protein
LPPYFNLITLLLRQIEVSELPQAQFQQSNQLLNAMRDI